MSSVQDFNDLKQKLLEIPPEDVQSPSTPVHLVLQGAEDLHYWAQKDREVLVGVGMDPQLIEELQPRTSALRISEGNWYHIRDTHAKAQQQWKEEAPKAYELRNKLVHEFLFAFRNDETLVRKVRGISSGGGYADMIQDLVNLSILGQNHKEELGKINFDMSQLDTAMETADSMADLLGVVNAVSPLEKEALDLRDRAFTYLNAVMTEIRSYGKFVFYRNRGRYKGYVNHYRRRNRRGTETDTTESVEIREAA